ncbi:MAG: tetratricopeptide repeat protein, partial [Acidobacteria bacterium]|nr:tetratricopeptide repeat protein [Acidobacteriota bacterium]
MADIVTLEQQAIDFARRGDFGLEAKRVNEELARHAPQNQGAWTRLARCCVELGLLDEATVAIDAVLQLNPQNTIARNLQGDVA